MKRGTIPVGKDYELEYRYYDKDPTFKYFNRKFEIFLLEKKTLRRNYVMHMDNADIREGNWMPHIYKASNPKKQLTLGISTLNWNDMKKGFLDHIVTELGEPYREPAKNAVKKLSSPKA